MSWSEAGLPSVNSTEENSYMTGLLHFFLFGIKLSLSDMKWLFKWGTDDHGARIS